MRNAARRGVWATCVCVLMLAHASLSAGSPLPAPWVNQDIGAVGLPGSASASAGVFTVSGAGGDIWGSTDAFQSVMQPVTGDVQIITRVTAMQNTNTYAKAGLMLRASLAAGSAHVILDLRPNGEIEFMVRSASGGSTSWISGSTQATPAWLKLTRTGTSVAGFVSSNGSTWTQVGTTTLSIPAAAYAGLAVTSHDVTKLNTSTFDNLTVVGVIPSPFTNQDVGLVGLAGGTTYLNGVFTVSGAGADIWGSADAFQAVSQPLAGDVQIIARVSTIQNTATYAKAGIMLRDSTASGARHVILDLVPNGGIEFMARSATGGSTSWLSGATQTAPVWLKLTRAGSTVTGYVSTTGTTWTQVGVTSLTFGAAPIGALIVTSHDVTKLNTSTFDNVSAGPLPIVAPPPSAPSTPLPVSGTTGASATPTTLTWTAGGATSYDVRFGATNPPAQVATGISSASYLTPALQQGATYYWQVVAKNVSGATAGAVWSFSTLAPPPPPPPPPPPAPSAPSSPAPISGATNITTSTALAWTASGATSYDVFFGATNPPALAAANLGSPAYAVANLQQGTPYFWQVVARNTSGATAGPVWSFSTQQAPPPAPSSPSPSSGATGVSSSAIVLSWTSAGATSYDVLAGATNPPAQVASNIPASSYSLSNLQQGQAYYWQIVARNAGGSTSGPVWSFTTQAAPPPSSGAPTNYSAVTDRLAYPKPPLPQLGSAGFSFNDPTFGSKIVRITDGSTRPGLLNRSYRIPSNSHLAAWNANATAFYVISNDGTSIPYRFDAATMTASRLQTSTNENGGLTFAFYVEPQFSLNNPDLVYGVGGSNNRTVSSFSLSTGQYTTIINLDNVTGGLANTYVGTMMTGGVPSEKLLTLFGGSSQDLHFYALWTPLDGSASKLVNTVASTINGVATSTTLNFHLHAVQIDKSGRYVFLYPTGPDLSAPRSAAQVYLWDTTTDAITAITAAMHPSGHDAAGFGVWINQDCCTSSSWDSAQWQFRSLATPEQTSDLISPVLPVKEIYQADHQSWNNAQPDQLVPVISSTYRYGADTSVPWRAWDDEIIGIQTSTHGVGGTVWRFAHHRSNIGSDSNPAQPYFWYEPISNISPDGKWVLFTSNWEKTLGTDSSEGTARQDVFLVQLTPHP
jgi:hypothetical protein